MVVQLPSEVVGTAVGVLVYSAVCLTCSCFLMWLVWVHHERTSYVALLAFFTSLSTISSITQQIHTIVQWRDIKLAQYDYSVANVGKSEIAIAGLSTGLDLVLFYIQFYCYNVQAMLVLFWACTLAQSVFQTDLFKPFKHRGPVVAKLSAVFIPALQISLLRTTAVQNDLVAFLVTANVIMGTSLTLGSCLMVTILLKYIRTRRAFLSWHVRYGRSDRSGGTASNGTVVTLDSANLNNSKRRSIYDKWLVLRFSIAFIALGIFQVVTIMFEVFSIQKNNADSLSASADLSTGRARTDFILFMPGVSASLLTFLVFGTTKTFREYMWVKLVPRAIRRRRGRFFRRKGRGEAGGSSRTPSFSMGGEVGSGRHLPYPQPPAQFDSDHPISPHVVGTEHRNDEDGGFDREMGRYTPTADGAGIRLRDMEHDGSVRKKHDDELPIFTTVPLRA